MLLGSAGSPLLPGTARTLQALQQLAGFARQVWQRLLPWLVPVGLIALWQIASSLGWLSTRVLPAPLEVITAFWTLTASGELWTHVQVSAARLVGAGGGRRFRPGAGASFFPYFQKWR